LNKPYTHHSEKKFPRF